MWRVDASSVARLAARIVNEKAVEDTERQNGGRTKSKASDGSSHFVSVNSHIDRLGQRLLVPRLMLRSQIGFVIIDSEWWLIDRCNDFVIIDSLRSNC